MIGLVWSVQRFFSNVFNIFLFHGCTVGQAQQALAAARDLDCDLLISFGTAGGVEGKVAIGDTVMGTGCVYVDRIRTNSKLAHDWGVYGGPAHGPSGQAHQIRVTYFDTSPP